METHGVRLATLFLPGRPKFGVPVMVGAKTPGDRPPFGCVLLIWERA